jgi:DNA replication and repair protein RecF
LSQRNAALRDESDSASVRAWDPTLVDAGSRVALERAKWIRESANRFSELYAEVAGESSALMRYESGIPESNLTDLESIAREYARALESSWSQDLRRGATRVGPHRDEVTFSMVGGAGERTLRGFGSAGEKRTAAFVLRLLEAETVRARCDSGPLFLLDDVFAELDEARSARVTKLLEHFADGQIVVAAPRESDVRFGRDRVAHWRLEAGTIES